MPVKCCSQCPWPVFWMKILKSCLLCKFVSKMFVCATLRLYLLCSMHIHMYTTAWLYVPWAFVRRLHNSLCREIARVTMAESQTKYIISDSRSKENVDMCAYMCSFVHVCGSVVWEHLSRGGQPKLEQLLLAINFWFHFLVFCNLYRFFLSAIR